MTSVIAKARLMLQVITRGKRHCKLFPRCCRWIFISYSCFKTEWQTWQAKLYSRQEMRDYTTQLTHLSWLYTELVSYVHIQLEVCPTNFLWKINKEKGNCKSLIYIVHWNSTSKQYMHQQFTGTMYILAKGITLKEILFMSWNKIILYLFFLLLGGEGDLNEVKIKCSR